MREQIGDDFSTVREDDEQWMSSEWVIHDINDMDIMYIWNCIKLLKRHSIRDNREYKVPLLMTKKLNELREEKPEYFL